MRRRGVVFCKGLLTTWPTGRLEKGEGDVYPAKVPTNALVKITKQEEARDFLQRTRFDILGADNL